MKCHQEYIYYKANIVPRILGPINYGALFGTAMSAAMNCIHGVDKGNPATCADAAVTDSITEYKSKGAVVDDDKVDDILKLLGPTIEKYSNTYPSLFSSRGWVVKESEWTVPNSGNSRIDLLLEDSNGTPIIIDAKWKRVMRKAEDEQRAIDDYQHDWKMKHYCYFVSAEYGKPILDYYIMLGIASPKFKVNIIPYSVSAQEMREWEVSAKQAWADMEDTTRPVTHAETCRDQYGLCMYYDLHFTYDGNFQEAGGLQYIQIERSKDK